MVIPSFTQTANAQSCGDPGINCDSNGNIIVEIDPGEVIGDPIDDPWDWGDSGGGYDPNPPGCNYIGCESEDDGGDDGGNNDPDDPDPPACKGNNSTALKKSGDDCEEKIKYCKQLDTLNGLFQGLLSGNNITGTAATGYSIAEGSVVLFQGALDGAYRDIVYYYSHRRHAPPNYLSRIIDWNQARVNWDLSGYRRFGQEHVFATWVQSVGLGNGASVLTDPDPSTGCPKTVI